MVLFWPSQDGSVTGRYQTGQVIRGSLTSLVSGAWLAALLVTKQLHVVVFM